jgi:hypothetical protein
MKNTKLVQEPCLPDKLRCEQTIAAAKWYGCVHGCSSTWWTQTDAMRRGTRSPSFSPISSWNSGLPVILWVIPLSELAAHDESMGGPNSWRCCYSEDEQNEGRFSVNRAGSLPWIGRTRRGVGSQPASRTPAPALMTFPPAATRRDCLCLR